ncbi:general secretion pathway protein GspD [Ralstonia pickettii]|uniref:General secretion pathway protein GspD n=1 Tax=Ralstonia pickettii TaxID=329 RepID=A0AAW4QEQ8_RALPI|nr:secretin and TonB N-terminal domain-containing protein [Ralstonia pickettii]MBX3757067.1 general secretion pathway protein GspD [Ralstonia pickettii]MBX3785767.1 general secretion pathway protein GspD [Ralstonia pickettii]MBX3791255.1 general secretion pathway protein GspD [Ralstonia pickettii]MBX3878110.1 general secretion pathway protein GspD [Ralstonia pickettii]MBX3888023.1 general secretion pathway protein GspD [Ralstonia pickettii]
MSLRWLCLVATFALLSGCASYLEARRADQLIAEGDNEAGLVLLAQLAKTEPADYKLKYIRTRDGVLRDMLLAARRLTAAKKTAEAQRAYQAMLRIDPVNEAATAGLASLDRDAREAKNIAQADAALKAGDTATATRSLQAALLENADQQQAKQMLQSIELEKNRSLTADPILSKALKKPVTLELRDVGIQNVLEILSRTSNINFVLDKDVKTDIKTTIFAKNTSVEDALNLVLRTSQLHKKILNESTLLIYSDTEEKKRRYEDLVMRTFYLKSADPKKMQDMVKALIAPKSLYVDERFKMLVVRDNLDVISAIERLVATYDIADPEVLLEVEILEVNSNGLLNAGIQYPDNVSVGVFGRAGVGGQLAMNELSGINRNNFQLFLPNPLAVLNLKQTSSDAKTLANPRIRVTNRQKAKVLIGDKVPVITTTVNQTSSASTESISYLDVGLKLEVQPEIHVNEEVTIGIDLEVSNVVKEIRSTTGLLAYQIGTRNASTMLRLHDGETQVLAGLIKDEQSNSSAGIPGIGRLPVVGRLFSNQTDTNNRSEIVLLITPRIVRSMPTPPAYVVEFPSGTADSASVRPLRLTPGGQYSGSDAQLTQVPQASSEPTGAPPVVGAPPVPGAPVGGATAFAPLASMQQSVAQQVSLQTPDRVQLGGDFRVVINYPQPYDSIEFDLVMDQPGIELVNSPSPSANGAAAATQIAQAGQTIHVKAGKRAEGGPTVAMVTMKATKQPSAPISLSVQNLQVKGADGNALPATVALPKQLTVQR